MKTNTIFCSILGVLALVGGISRFSATNSNNSGAGNPALEHGKNLTFNICGQCHYDEKTKHFTGKLMSDLPGFLGKIYSSNLTHSDSFGILNKYSNAQLINLLKTGTGRDGKYVPWMVRPNLSDQDLEDIIIYLRSNDTAVVAVNSRAGVTEETVMGRLAEKVVGKPLPYKRGVKTPPEKDSVAMGKYLIDNLACYHCHSKGVTSLDYLEPENSKGYLQGGMKFKTPEGKKVYASNLTSDKETGIGRYTQKEFRKILQMGIYPNGDFTRLPMQRFKHLTNKQVDAIYAYLMTVPAKKNKIKR